jgi:hypothetical protein
MVTTSTAYLISRIRCNNILIWILLHLILEIRYAVPSNFFHTRSQIKLLINYAWHTGMFNTTNNIYKQDPPAGATTHSFHDSENPGKPWKGAVLLKPHWLLVREIDRTSVEPRAERSTGWHSTPCTRHDPSSDGRYGRHTGTGIYNEFFR